MPFNWTVEPPIESTSDKSGSLEFELASDYSIIKILVGIFQIVYTTLNLYSSRGHQLDKYGYAAYTLTVVPYIMMSGVNLLAALCQSRYPSRFIVIYKGKQKEGTSMGVCGELCSLAEPYNSTSNNPCQRQNERAGCKMEANNIAKVKEKIAGTVGVAYGALKTRQDEEPQPPSPIAGVPRSIQMLYQSILHEFQSIESNFNSFIELWKACRLPLRRFKRMVSNLSCPL